MLVAGAVGGVEAVRGSTTVTMSLGASCVVNNSKRTRREGDREVPKISPRSNALHPDRGIDCRPEVNQGHVYRFGGLVDGHGFTIIDDEVSNAWSLTITGICGGTAEEIIANV